MEAGRVCCGSWRSGAKKDRHEVGLDDSELKARRADSLGGIVAGGGAQDVALDAWRLRRISDHVQGLATRTHIPVAATVLRRALQHHQPREPFPPDHGEPRSLHDKHHVRSACIWPLGLRAQRRPQHGRQLHAQLNRCLETDHFTGSSCSSPGLRALHTRTWAGVLVRLQTARFRRPSSHVPPPRLRPEGTVREYVRTRSACSWTPADIACTSPPWLLSVRPRLFHRAIEAPCESSGTEAPGPRPPGTTPPPLKRETDNRG